MEYYSIGAAEALLGRLAFDIDFDIKGDNIRFRLNIG
jgi:hypothetical protein